MAEYIEREAVKKLICELCNDCDGGADVCEYRDIQVDAIPAADVRPVVLCAECKHNKGARVWQFLDLKDVTADCSAGHGYPPMDWFCADGEKREER